MADVAVADRTLPHNLEAERSVLGAILLHNEAFNHAAEVIDAQDFYRDAHRRIFDKMVALAERGDAIDLVTLKEELGRSGDLDEVGGPAYIAALVDGVPRSTNVEHYARIIKEKSTLRRLIYSANKIVASAYVAEDDADVILDEAEHAIFAIADDKVRDGFVSLRDLAQASLDTIEKLHARKELITGVPTGFTDLDELTSGFQPSDLIIVAARPSMGKTSLVLNIAQHVGTKTDLSVGIFSLEMSKEQLFLRMLTAEARIDAHRLRGGFLGERDWGRLAQAIGTLSEAKIFIDDTPSIGVLEMRAKCRRLAAEHGLNLVIVDYIQLMQGRGRFENRTLELGAISRSVKALAKELRVPIIVLSQLSRAPESRSDHRPQLSDLRECVTGDTLVALADGRRLPIRDLVGTQPVVWAYSSGALSTAQSDKVWMVGRRPVHAVRLASGRVIRATAEHRLLTERGWTEIGRAAIGDRVALARQVPEPADAQPWPELRVALLGQLIGDGSYLNNQPLRYTTASSENSEIVVQAARQEFGCAVTRYEGPTGTWHQLLITGNGDRWHPAGVNAWLRDLGIFGQRSYQKRIPAAAFRLPNAQIALLLRHLWATDGCIAQRRRGRGAANVYYATNSEGLASDVAALLLRLGIVARIGIARKAGYRPGYHVRVSGSDNQRIFLNLVGAHGPRVEPARALALALDGVVANTNVDTLPRAIFERVLECVRERKISHQQLADLRETTYGGTNFRFAPSRATVLEYAELLDADDLRAAATDVLFWDRVVSIEPAGEHEVYDLTVPGPANWLADSVVTHNSGALEQDSDVVVFIYREDQYADKSAPAADNQGVAELIIGKQRNGPTGVVKLAFIREFTRFENLALGKA